MKRIRTNLPSMAAGFLTAALVWLPDIARADDPRFTIVNKSKLGMTEAQFYYLGVGTHKVNNRFLILMKDGSWVPAGSPHTQWNSNGFNPSGPKGNKLGAGVVPCHKLVTTEVEGTKTYPTVTLPPNLVGARIYFFMVRPDQTAWFRTPRNNDYENACNVHPVSNKNQASGIFGNVFTAGVGGAMPFSYFSKMGSGGYNGASPASILQNSLPLYTFSEVGGPDPKNHPAVADIDASQVDLISFPTNIIAQIDQRVVGAGTSTPTSEGVGFSFSLGGEVNMQAVILSFTEFAKSLPTGEAHDYKQLKVHAPNNGGEFLVNPGNYLSFINPSGAVFNNHFLKLIEEYLWSSTLNGGAGWMGKIDLGGIFQVKSFPAVPQLIMHGQAVDLSSQKGKLFPGYTGELHAIKFTATVNKRTFVAYVLSPVSYASLCNQKSLASCPANVTPAYQIFAGDGALSATGTDQIDMLKKLNPNAAKVWSNYDGVKGRKIYNLIVARLGLIISNAFNRGVAGGLPNGLCANEKYKKNISYCWSDQANWYPNGSDINLSEFHNEDITQNQFARWLHTSEVLRTGSGAPIPIMTQPTNTITTKSKDVMGMAYGFGYDENPTPQLPGATGQQTPAEYSSNVLSNADSSPAKNCITIMPYYSGNANPTPPANSCVP